MNDYYFEEEYKFLPDVGAYERTYAQRPEDIVLGTYIGDGNRYTDIQKKIHRLNLSPQERFNQLFTIAVAEISSIPTISLTDNEIEDIKNRSSNIPKIYYKNPVALTLGYYFYVNKQKNFLKEFNKIKEIEIIENIKPEDLVRYIRIWEKVFNEQSL
jgi:hypothetical protein